MKKVVAVGIVLGAMAVSASATQLFWFAGSGVQLPGMPGEDASNWQISCFIDSGDGAIDTFGPGGVASNGDTLHYSLPGGNPAGAGAIGWSNNQLFVDAGEQIYTVIFNNTDYTLASHYVVVDDDLFTVPDAGNPPQPKQYNAGGAVADDWQVIPEPSSLALMGLGVVALVARRFRKK